MGLRLSAARSGPSNAMVQHRSSARIVSVPPPGGARWRRKEVHRSAPARLALLAARSTLGRRLRDVENSVRGILRGFGIRVPRLLRGRWSDGVRGALQGNTVLLGVVEPLLAATQALRDQLAVVGQACTGCRPPGCRLPAANDHARCGSNRGAHLPRRRRPARALQVIAAARPLLRSYPQTLSKR